MVSARFSVGIDLGTTHCALAEAPLEGEPQSPRIQPILQLTARDRVDQSPLLPSFLYYPHAAEGALALPWNAGVPLAVGQYARRRAAESPGRVVASSKSWLSHPSVDRHAPVLPLNAAEDVTPVSP